MDMYTRDSIRLLYRSNRCDEFSAGLVTWLQIAA